MNLKQRLGKRKIKDNAGGGYVAMWTNLYNPLRSVPVAMSNDYNKMKEYINQHCETYVREQGRRFKTVVTLIRLSFSKMEGFTTFGLRKILRFCSCLLKNKILEL